MFVLYILLAIVILLVMVVIHEFGHYIAGKLLNFKINEFAVGFGPKIFSKKRKNGEVFSLRLLPLGGFCLFEGEDEIVSGGKDIVEKNQEEKPKFYNKKGVELLAFNKQPPWKRIIVLASGAILNLISAVFFSILFISIVGFATPKVSAIFNSPNATILQNGDIITEVNGKKIGLTSFEEYMEKIGENEDVVFTVVRDDQTLSLTAKKQYYLYYLVEAETPSGNPLKKGDVIMQLNGIPIDAQNKLAAAMSGVGDDDIVELKLYRVVDNELTQPTIEISGAQYKQAKASITEKDNVGIGFSSGRVYIRPSFFKALGYSVPFTGKLSWSILDLFGKLVTGKLPIFGSLGGPITTVTTIAEVTQENALNILVFLPLIAANLGIFNLLPVPALDGSKIVFCLIEWIRKKPVNRKVEAWIHFGGLVFILGLVLIVEVFNIIKMF